MRKLLKDYAVNIDTPDFQSDAEEVTQGIDDGMAFDEAIELMKVLEDANSPMKRGFESCTSQYTIRNRNGEQWELVVQLFGMNDFADNERTYDDDADYRFLFFTFDHGQVAYHEWLEQEVL